MQKKIIGLLMVACWLTFLTAGAANKPFTLVIDAGHGGGDAGAIGPGKVKEKDLTLRYALAFGRMVEQNCPDVKVIYTRKTDKFVELYRRAEMANRNKADLFISIHINSLPKGRVARGFQTYTLGTSKRTGKKNGVLENLEVAKRENDVIYLEKDYKQTYHGYDPNSPESNILFEFVQDKNMENSVELAKYMQRYVCKATGRQDMGAQQDNLAVLRLSSMPGCLVECGFISTRDEEQYMNSKVAEGQYARGLFNAFQAYRKNHGGNITVPYKPAEPEKEQPAPKRPATKEPPAKEPTVQEPTVQEPAGQEPAVQESSVQAAGSDSVQVASPSAPVFKVQIFVSSSSLKDGDARFKGLTDTDSYQESGLYKYTVGASENYNQIYQLRKSVLDKFPQAFIIAFRDSSRMDVNEAIREYKNHQVKK